MISDFFAGISDFLQNTPIYSLEIISLLIAIGFFVGFINTIAGMATAISYAVFMAMGLPINIANGTTRVGVFSQFLVTSLIFKKKGYLNLETGWRVGIPVGIGSLAGAALAAVLSPGIIEIVMAVLLPIMALLLFVDPKKYMGNISDGNKKIQKMPWWKIVIFFCIGIYGGFTHVGVGLLIMFGSFFMLGMDLIRSNGIKQFAVLIYTPLALIVFIIYGQVNWPLAIIYAVGNVLGGVAGSYASIKGGDKLIKIFVALVIFLVSGWMLLRQLY